MGEGRLGAELAVGHVQKVRPPGELSQHFPGLDVRSGVAGVAIQGPVVDGDGTVGGHAQDEQKLLEVGTVILVVTVGDQDRRLSANLSAVGCLVVARQGEGGGVVMQLVQVDVELSNRPQDKFRQEGRAVGVEEAVQGSAHPIVVEQGCAPPSNPMSDGSARAAHSAWV